MAFALNAGATFSGSRIGLKPSCRAARVSVACRAQQKGEHAPNSTKDSNE